MKTYIVMPHYIATPMHKELATQALKSFRKSSPDAFIVSVSDGCPLDNSFLDELSDHVIRKEKNDGFAITCNTGFNWVFEQLGDEDAYIVCANNDIEVYPGWHEAMIEQMEWFPGEVAFAGLVSMPEYMEKNGQRAVAYDYPHNGPDIPLAQWSRTKVTEGGYLDHWMQSGGLWMSTKSMLQKIGLFDEQFAQAAMEDVDIFLRARDKFGLHILMSAKSIFWHKEGATRRGWDKAWEDMCLKFERENEDKYAAKWGAYYHGEMPWKEKILRE